MTARILVAVCMTILFAQDVQARDKALVRSQIDPANVAVGQQARLLVDVLFPDQMLHPPRVEIPPTDGVQVFRFESQATNINDQISGHDYVGQRFEFDIYPRRNGQLTIPAATVYLLDEGGAVAGQLSGAPERLVATIPPGFDAFQPIVAAPDVTLRARWEPSHSKFHVGDAVTLIVTRTTESVPGLSLSGIPVPDIDGLRTYTEPPLIDDRVDRGDVTGIRTDRMTFVFEKAGNFVLPGISQKWWDTENQEAKTLMSEPLSISAAAVADTSAAKDIGSDLEWWPVVLASAIVLACLLLALLGHWLRRSSHAKQWHLRHQISSELRLACMQQDARQAYRAVVKWRSHWPDCVKDAKVMAALGKLEKALFGNVQWSESDAAALRSSLLTRRWKVKATTKTSPLSPLNPTEQ